MQTFKNYLNINQLKEITQGKLLSDKDLKINSVGSLLQANSSSIAFFHDMKYMNQLIKSQAGLILIPAKTDINKLPQKNYVLCKKPYQAFLKVLEYFIHLEKGTVRGKKIDPTSKINPKVQIPNDIIIKENVTISEDVNLGKGVVIEAGVLIKNSVEIGSNTHIYPNVVIYPNTKIGKNVVIHSGSVIGSDGFGYIWNGSEHHKIPQIGGVIIKKNVEIGANVTIDRGTLDFTIIEEGTKIDNLVQIAHNVQIGKNVIICSQVGIAGSSIIGNNVILAGQVGISDHVKIGNNVKVAAQSGVSNDVKDNMIIFGYPARDVKLQKRIIASQKELPSIRRYYHKLMKKEEGNDTKK